MLLLLSRPAVFVPQDEARELNVVFDFSPGTTLEHIAEKGIEISRLLQDAEGLEIVFARSGAEDEDVSYRANIEYKKERLIFRCFLQKSYDAGDIARELQFLLAGKYYNNFTVGFPQDRTERLLGLSSANTFALKGNSREDLEEKRETVRKIIDGNIPNYAYRPSGSRPEIKIFPDREAAAFLGISTYQIAEALYAATEGVIAGRIETGGRPFNIRVSPLNSENKGLPLNTLEQLPIVQKSGIPIPLGVLVHIEQAEADAELARLDRSDVLYLDVYPEASGSKTTATDIEALLSSQTGITRSDESAFSRYQNSLVITLFLVIILLYMTIGAQFESFILPLIVMLTIPFSVAGAGPSLFLLGAGIDSGSVLGLVVLFGLVVNNGIVLYEISLEKINEGYTVIHGVYSGSSERLQPVLITTLTTICALFPVLISPMASSQRSMAAAMLGGMIVSTALTLFILPAVFIKLLKPKEI
jgi:multidrug efflux pump subunit AcrB